MVTPVSDRRRSRLHSNSTANGSTVDASQIGDEDEVQLDDGFGVKAKPAMLISNPGTPRLPR